MGGAGADRSQGTGPSGLNRAMHVPAHDALDLRMARDDRRQPLGARFKAHGVELGDAAGERRMVRKAEWGDPILELRCQPVEPGVAKFAMRRSRHQGIETDKAQRMALDRIPDERAALQMPMIRKRRSQILPHIVIAGE